jgi:glycine betaine/proline transport system permease protein
MVLDMSWCHALRLFLQCANHQVTNLGIRQLPKEMIEVSDAFVATMVQTDKSQLPVALPTIMAGVIQGIMVRLMTGHRFMIGAGGLGY